LNLGGGRMSSSSAPVPTTVSPWGRTPVGTVASRGGWDSQSIVSEKNNPRLRWHSDPSNAFAAPHFLRDSINATEAPGLLRLHLTRRSVPWFLRLELKSTVYPHKHCSSRSKGRSSRSAASTAIVKPENQTDGHQPTNATLSHMSWISCEEWELVQRTQV
jgi:hypothetical protein